MRTFLLSISCMGLLWGWGAPLSTLPASTFAALQADAFDADTSARQALQSREELPWYDSQGDALKRIDVEPAEDDWKRQSDWTAGYAESTQKRAAPRSKFWITLMRALAWTGLGLLAALIIWALVWGISRIERPDGDEEAEEDVELTKGRIEELPLPVAPHHTDLLAAARAYYDAGDLGKAIIYAFAHQLVELDKHHLIQLTKGKTNRQYLGELRAHPHFADLLRPTMLAFEAVFFGHHQISRQRFEACWQDLDRFHEQLEQVAL